MGWSKGNHGRDGDSKPKIEHTPSQGSVAFHFPRAVDRDLPVDDALVGQSEGVEREVRSIDLV
jgi:hypothetical protein